MKKTSINRLSRTKIVATIGPASHGYTEIRKMVNAGMDVVRLNFSHGSFTSHSKVVDNVMKINKKYRRHIRIMQDLEGFRIRVRKFKGSKPKMLLPKKTVFFTKEPDTGESNIIPFDYEGDLARIRPGKMMYINDGNIILKIKKSSKTKISAEVVEGGILKERKGINMPGVKIPFSGVTPKDKKDIEFARTKKIDFVAQSFVRTKKDIYTVRDMLGSSNNECKIIAKIESTEAIKNIDEIIEAADGIMVARGDMGIAVPIYQVPMIQKEIIRKCNKQKKFVITATQMLEHMTEHSRPTRAEVTDVANAIIDGTDYVMLSEETAAGAFPVKAVDMMDHIIKYTESFIVKKEEGVIYAD
jgi:pyruvate kinase